LALLVERTRTSHQVSHARDCFSCKSGRT